MIKFEDWCRMDSGRVDDHRWSVMTACDDKFDVGVESTSAAVPNHLVVAAKSLNRLRKNKSAAMVRQMISKNVNVRLGNLGEILATEWINGDNSDYTVPINRLFTITNPNMPQYGDDIVGFQEIESPPGINFLKGEVKSHKKVSSRTINAAQSSLKKYSGSPSPHSLIFTLNILRFRNAESPIADKMENLMSEDTMCVPAINVQHLIFIFSKNCPKSYIIDSLKLYNDTIKQIYVGLQVENYKIFVKRVYKKAAGDDKNS